MKEFIWKVRYTFVMYRLIKAPMHICWECAESWVGYKDKYSPYKAVVEELSCWAD